MQSESQTEILIACEAWKVSISAWKVSCAERRGPSPDADAA